MLDLTKYTPQWVKISDINLENKMFQFRKDITPESVAELAESLKADGQKFPVVLWRRNNGEIVIISGWRRVTAAKQLGWEKVLGVVIPETDLPEDDALKLNFVENIARKTLTNPDIIFACKKLKERGMTNEAIGKAIGGKSENQVRRYLKVADAPEDIQAKVKAGEASIRSVDEATSADRIASRGDSTPKNKNCYVKSMKNGFDAVLRYRYNKDTPDVADGFVANIRKAVSKAATSPRRPETGNDKGKGGVGGGFSRRDDGMPGVGVNQGEKERGLKPAATKPDGGFSPGNVAADSSAPSKVGPADLPAFNKDSQPPKDSGWRTVAPGGTDIPGGSLKNLMIERQKGMLDQIKKLAADPKTRPMAEQMAKASDCQSIEEFIAKMEKQFGGREFEKK